MRFSDFLLVSNPTDLDFIVGYTDDQNIRINVLDLFVGQIIGSGTAGYIPLFTSANVIDDSVLYQDGSNIVIGGEDSLGYRLAIAGSLLALDGAVIESSTPGSDTFRTVGEDGDSFIIPNDSDESVWTSRRIMHAAAILSSESATLGQVNTAISDLEGDIEILLDLKVDKSSVGEPNGVASLDSTGKIPLSEIPDSIIGQVEYMGTWNAFTNTPTLNPLFPEQKGHYYVVSAAGVFGGVDYAVGDWIISNGVEWQKVDNTDAVTSVFGRIGAILPLEADYQSFYPRLSQAYDNPTWINSLAFTKITDVPPFLLENQTITLSGDVTGSGKTSISSTISNNAVSNEKLRDSVGTSVIGRSASSTGDPADIQAGTDGHVLLRSAGNLLFGLISSDSISSIDWSKITGTPTTLSGYGITDAYTKTESDNKFVPYTGASANVNLGSNNITANSFIKAGGTSSQFLKADGSVDLNHYVPNTRSVNAGTGLTGGGNLSSDVTISFDTTWGDTRYAYRTRQLTINGITFDLSADRTWNVGTVTSVGLSAPTGFAVSNSPVTSSGTLALSFSSGYSLPTNAVQANWTTAYNDSIISAAVTGTATKTLTLNQQDGGTITASWSDIDTAPVTSVFGRLGDVVAQSGDYNTSQVTESGNLYFTNARSRSAVSLTTTGNSGASTYDNGTGVLNVPQYTLSGLGGVPTTRTLTINGTAFDLSADRSWSVGTVTSIATTGPIQGGTITGTGTISITQAGSASDGYLSSTDWNTFNNKQATISLTTTGNSGSSTLISNVLNVPTYTLAGLGGVPTTRTITINGLGQDLSADRTWTVGTIGGTIASGQVAFGTAANTIGGDNGLFWDNVNKRLGVGLTNPESKLHIGMSGANAALILSDAGAPNTLPSLIFRRGPTSANSLVLSFPNNTKAVFSIGDAIQGIDFAGTVVNLTGGQSIRFGGVTGQTATAILGSIHTDNNNGQLLFSTRGSGVTSERMRVNNLGNILINITTDAGFRLDVNGTARVQGVLTTTADAVIDGITVGNGASNNSLNTVVGLEAGTNGSLESSNSFFGYRAGRLTTGANNSFFGFESGVSNAAGANNVFFGRRAGRQSLAGVENCFIGSDAGRVAADNANNSSCSSSILLGFDSRPLANGESNQIVIAHNGRGLGSNTTVIGNSSTTFGRWFGNLLVGSSTNSGQMLQVTGTSLLNGLSTIQGTTASDSGQLGAELLTTGTGDASWTGTSFATGYTHVAGSTTTLTSTLAGVVNTFYQITYTVTGRTAGSFVIDFGGFTSFALTATGAVGPRATTTGTLVITPTSDFNGTIVLSIRVITASSASVTFNSSNGTNTNQIRISSINTNTFVGRVAGQNNTTGIFNSFFGSGSGSANTTGSSNSFFGLSSGAANTIGTSNSFFGVASGLANTTGTSNSFFGRDSGLANTTGGANSFFGVSSGAANTTGTSNSFFGVSSGAANTTGSNNVFIGRQSGRVISGGADLTIANNSVFVGFDTRAAADNQTNQIVIGHQAIGLGSNTTVLGNTSTTFGRWYGSLLLGTTTNAASSILTMESTTQGFLPPRMTAAQRTAIASPATGLVVYQTDGVEGLYVRTSTAWRALGLI